MRLLVLLLVVAATVVALDGCGSASAPVGSSSATASTASPALTPPGSPGSVAASTGGNVPLGISPAQLEQRLGTPAVAMRQFPGGLRCSLYRIAEQPPFVKLRYCFAHGHLKFLATYAVEAGQKGSQEGSR